jgi:hypothetical protein
MAELDTLTQEELQRVVDDYDAEIQVNISTSDSRHSIKE